VKEADLARGSRWLRQHMAVNESHIQSPQAQFYQKQDGSPLDEHSGFTRNGLKLVAHQRKCKFRTGIELEDVAQLEWVNGDETYFYARGYGLVGWERTHQEPHTPAWSAISEIHQPNAREPFRREMAPVR
jgi:hypothetical protein